MTNEFWLMLGVFIIGLVVLIGFFATKTKGFGRYATSTLLLVFVFLIASLLYSAGKLESNIFFNIIFAIVGFAGGLVTDKLNNLKE